MADKASSRKRPVLILPVQDLSEQVFINPGCIGRVLAVARGNAPGWRNVHKSERMRGTTTFRIDMDHQKLGTVLKTIADEHWQQRRQPVFLSSLPPLLGVKGLTNYKEMLGGQTLRQFIKNWGPNYGCKLVEHPTLRAKLALVPLDVPFDFTADLAQPSVTAITKEDVETFFRVLTFVADDGSNFMLPASVIAKLVAIR